MASRSTDMNRGNRPGPEFIARIVDIVGAANAITAPDDQAAYLREWRGLYVGKTPLVVRPASTEEVARVMAAAHEAGVAVVPQSGNTGLVGGQIPFEDGEEIVLSLTRLKNIRSVDPAGRHMTVEAGLTLTELRQAAEQAGRLFPLSLASEGSCQLGGNLATNAGGVNVLAYGNARDLVLGLEVVLADGRIWNGLRALKKDNTGYDLRDLFIGSEGTLGVITAAVVKLFPRPAEQATAFAAAETLDSVLELFLRAEAAAGGRLTAFEFLSDYSLDIVTRHVPGTRRPYGGRYPWHVLIEVDGATADGGARSLLEGLLGEALERGDIVDAVVAESLQQRGDLWRLREELSDAQRHEGGSIKHDVSVATGRIPEFVRQAEAVVQAVCPGARPVVFGHFGDGNVHFNVTQPETMDKAEYLALWEEMADRVHGLITEMDGSISAEHGIGRLKRQALAELRGPVEIDLMRAIKQALDPNGILNPGKLLSRD